MMKKKSGVAEAKFGLEEVEGQNLGLQRQAQMTIFERIFSIVETSAFPRSVE
jgi:hypothetical protein